MLFHNSLFCFIIFSIDQTPVEVLGTSSNAIKSLNPTPTGTLLLVFEQETSFIETSAMENVQGYHREPFDFLTTMISSITSTPAQTPFLHTHSNAITILNPTSTLSSLLVVEQKTSFIETSAIEDAQGYDREPFDSLTTMISSITSTPGETPFLHTYSNAITSLKPTSTMNSLLVIKQETEIVATSITVETQIYDNKSLDLLTTVTSITSRQSETPLLITEPTFSSSPTIIIQTSFPTAVTESVTQSLITPNSVSVINFLLNGTTESIALAVKSISLNKETLFGMGLMTSSSLNAMASDIADSYRSNDSSKMYTEWTPWSACDSICTRVRYRYCATNPWNSWHYRSCSYSDTVEYQPCMDKCLPSEYFLADSGMSCLQYCNNKGRLCSSDYGISNANIILLVLAPFKDLNESVWQNDYAPYCDQEECAEYIHIPEYVSCEATPPEHVERLCYCLELGDVGYGTWSSWSFCSATCSGVRRRFRTCFGYCSGQSEEDESCNTGPCPVHGGFSPWTEWSRCDKSCGIGLSYRSRECNNPSPSFGGSTCFGLARQTEQCNVHYCPVDAQFSVWTTWSACDKPCNGGKMIRTRQCKEGFYGGTSCFGPLEEYIQCTFTPCPRLSVNFQIAFEGVYQEGMNDIYSSEFSSLQNEIQYQINQLYNQTFDDAIHDVVLHTARNGSIIVNFTIVYSGLDSYQIVYAQDCIEVDRIIGKIPILPEKCFFVMSEKVPTDSPSEISLHSNSTTSIRVFWKPMRDVVGYVVWYRELSRLSSPYHCHATFNSSALITNLLPFTLYVFRILAYNNNGNGYPSAPQFKHTLESAPTLPPSNLHAHSYIPSAIIFEWDRVVDEAIIAGYTIRYRKTICDNSTEIHTVTPYVKIENLDPGFVYEIAVSAFNMIGEGPFERIYVESGTEFEKMNVWIADYKSHNRITLFWNKPDPEKLHHDLLGYEVSYTENHSKFSTSYVSLSFLVHPTETSMTITDLKPNTEYDISFRMIQENGESPPQFFYEKTCSCPSEVSINYYDAMPYVYHNKQGDMKGVFVDILDDMIQFACGTCNRASGSKLTKIEKHLDGRKSLAQKPSLHKVIQEIDEFTDLTFPIVGKKELEVFLGYEYVPLVEHPGIVFITKDKSTNEAVASMVMVIANVLPLIGLNMLFMTVVGIMMWIIEGYHPRKETDFSRKLLTGLQEALYWAFITQGTHGYGDYVARHFTSRLLSIAWILLGLVMTALITGSITSAVTSVEYSTKTKIYDTKIGALNGSFEQQFGILRNGKVSTKVQYTTTSQLVDALIAGNIDGILVDASTAGSSKRAFRRSQIRPTGIFKYPRTYGFVLSGDLRNVADEVRDFIQINEKRILYLIANSSTQMQPMQQSEPTSPFVPSSSVFKLAIRILPATLLVFLFCGVIYTVHRMMRKRKVVPCKKEYEKIQRTKDLTGMIETFAISFQNMCRELQSKHDEQLVDLFQNIKSEKVRSVRNTDTVDKGPLGQRILEEKNDQRILEEKEDYSSWRNSYNADESLSHRVDDSLKQIEDKQTRRKGKEKIGKMKSHFHSDEERQVMTYEDLECYDL